VFLAGLACAAVLLVICGLLPAEPGTTRKAFFRQADPAGQDLPDDAVYPRGRMFPISLFSVGGSTSGVGAISEDDKQAIMQRVADDGFTMFGPQYEINHRLPADAAAHGVQAIYTIRGRDESGQAWSKDDLRGLTDEQVRASIRREVQQALADEHADSIAWWYLQPEELRYWRKHEIRYLEVAAETIREVDPRGRPVWMYDPGHRNAAALAKTAPYLDILGKGMYTNYSGMVDQRVWCRWSIEQEVRAIEDSGSDAIPIAVLEMFQHPGRHVEALAGDEEAAVATIRRWARHDAYAALVAGARGMVIFSLRQRETGDLHFSGAIHDAYYQTYADVAGELTGEPGLGDVFLFGERRDDLSVEVLSGPSTQTLEYQRNEPVEYPTVGLANIAFGRARYLFMVNSSGEDISAVISDLPYGDDITVRDLFTGKTFPLGEGELMFDFGPWGVQALRIEPPAEQ
jgi:hypothetical protein